MNIKTMNYDELSEHVTEAIAELRRKAYGEGYEQGKFDAEMDSNEGDRLVELSQERRDEIIEKAKKDVEELKDDYNGLYTVDNGGHRFHPYACTAEYIVDKYKRTVVVLMRGRSTGRVRARGIAKCAPNDCFNVHIGKAIALRRALGLEVPDEYLNAPQPTEVRVGDVIKMKYAGFDEDEDDESMYYTRIVKEFDGERVRYGGLNWDFIETVDEKAEILDDSRDE